MAPKRRQEFQPIIKTRAAKRDERRCLTFHHCLVANKSAWLANLVLMFVPIDGLFDAPRLGSCAPVSSYCSLETEQIGRSSTSNKNEVVNLVGWIAEMIAVNRDLKRALMVSPFTCRTGYLSVSVRAALARSAKMFGGR